MRIKLLPLLAAIAIIFTGLAVPVFATEDDPWSVTVTVDECSVTISPSGRTAYYEDSEGRTGGPIHTPDTVTLEFTSSGWIDVELIHDPGADEGESVTKRFDIPGPCDETTTTGATTTTGGTSSTTTPSETTTTSQPPPTSTTVPSSTTIPDATTTTRPTTSSTLPPSSTTSSTSSTVPPVSTTTTTPTASTTSSVPPDVTTTLDPPSSTSSTTSSTAPEATSTTEPVTDTTIVTSTLPDCPPDTTPTEDGCELPNTGMSAAQVFTIAVVALIAGVAILGASTVFGVWKEAKR